MIRILHLQTELNLACGVTRTISQIIKNSSSEFEHHLIALGGDGLNRFEAFNFNPIVLNFDRFSLIGALKIYFSLLNYCKKYSIQIIHSHHRSFDTITWLFKPFLKVKSITSVQSKVSGKNLLSYKSGTLIACSDTIKNHLIKSFKINENRIKVIYNSVDSAEAISTKTKTELLNSLDIPLNKYIIGYFGRFDFKEKGVDILLEAFLELSKTREDMFLLLIGDGVEENKVKSFIKINKLSNVKVISSQKDIYNYYQLLDVFVLPSRIEPFGIVLIEAGMMNRPIIASNVDGIPEIIENEKSGLLFKSENVEDLTKCILRLINDSELAENLAENLYNKVIDNFLTSNMVAKYEHEYKKLLNSNVI